MERIGEEHVVRGVEGRARLVDYLKARLVLVPVNEVGDLITTGRVRIVRGGAAAAGRTIDLVGDGDRIAIDAAALRDLEASGRWNPPWDHPVAIHHEDADLLVVGKDAGLHVHPLGDSRARTLVGALVHHAGGRDGSPWAAWRPHVVQRLDRVTSGLLVVAKGARSKAALVRLQKKRGIERRYLALVDGDVAGAAGTVDAPVGRDPVVRGRRAVVARGDGGRPAVTHWTVQRRLDGRTLVEVALETGRTHQIRVHLASLGHPVVGDALYGAAPWAEGHAIALHAFEVAFAHPRTGERLVVRVPPPARFDAGDGASGP